MQNTKLHRFGVFKENINIAEIFRLYPALSAVKIVCENITFFYLIFTLRGEALDLLNINF